MRSTLLGLRRWLTVPDRPLAAIEVRPRSLGCLRLIRESGQLRLGAASLVELAPGVVELSPMEPNVRDPEAFATALRRLVAEAELPAGSSVALVLPDAAARAVLLEGEIDTAGASLEDLVRFRLRKTLPFDVTRAGVAAVRLPAAEGAPAAVLAAVIASPVRESYEAPLAALQLLPGLVELSGLALSRFAEAGAGDRLLLNLEPEYLTLVLSRGGRPLLIRTLPGGYAGGLEGVARETRQTLLYHRDRLGGGDLAGATLRPSDDDTREVAGRLREALGCEPEALRPWASIGASLPPGRGGGLAGAAACLLARDAA